MADSVGAPPSAAPFPVTDPERIPVRRYYDEAFYKAENERLWPHVWQMACRLEQIPNVGDYVEYNNLGKSVIVVRTKSGVKAYHNACRHRGVPLAESGSHGNCQVQGFICPFHGWRWNMDGKNTFVYGRHMFSEKQLDQADLALRPCRVEEWGHCAFINFDDNAPSFRDSIGPAAENLEAHGLSNLRAEWWYATELPANWKIAMEAFMEGYHVMRTHPQLQQAAPMIYNALYATNTKPGTVEYDTGGIGAPIDPNLTVRQNIQAQFEHMKLLSDGMAGMMHAKEVAVAEKLLDVDLPEDPRQAVPMWYGIVQGAIVEALRAQGEEVPDLNAVAVSHPVTSVEFIFPNYFLLFFFSSVSAYRIRPTGPETCIFELWSLTGFPKGKEPKPVMQPTWLPYNSKDFPQIPQQDYSNIPIQQKGLHAEGFEFMRLSRDIEGMISNYQRLIDGYLNGVAPEKLAKANHLLGGNFDGKIKDMGF